LHERLLALAGRRTKQFSIVKALKVLLTMIPNDHYFDPGQFCTRKKTAEIYLYAFLFEQKTRAKLTVSSAVRMLYWFFLSIILNWFLIVLLTLFMIHRETPSKTDTAVILYYSSSEGIHTKEPKETHKYRPETKVLSYGSSSHNSLFKTNYCSYAQAFCHKYKKGKEDQTTFRYR